MGWQEETGFTDLINQLPIRPRPQSVLFAPNAPADPAGFVNPGAAILPDFAPISQPANKPVTAVSPGMVALKNSIIGRPNLNADLQGSQGPRLPQIFNGGVQQAPDIAIPATDGTAQPPGYRRTISADGGPTFFQQVRPEERGVNGQDLLRQGTSVAEIQAAHPGWSASQQLDLYRQLQQDAGRAARQNFAVGNESANQNAGIMSNADRAAAQTANAHTTQANAAQLTANYGASRNRLYDQIAAGIAANGGTASDLRGALAAAGFRPGYVRSDEGASANPAGSGQGRPSSQGTAPTQNAAPPVDSETARDDLHRTLDQHLRAAAGIAAPARGQQDLVVSLPGAVKREEANRAITNFVHSVAGAGLLTPENLPGVMSYMTQRMRANNVDPWFAERFGGLSGSGQDGHQDAVHQLQGVMSRRGVDIGNTGRSFRLGGGLGGVGQGVRNAIGGLFGQ